MTLFPHHPPAPCWAPGEVVPSARARAVGVGAHGLVRPPVATSGINAKIEVLRLVGRLEYALTSQIRALIYPDSSHVRAWRHLQELKARRWLGCMPLPLSIRNDDVSHARLGGSLPPPRPPLVWWLTPKGKQHLAALEAEPDQESLDGLKERAHDDLPAEDTLLHDLQASWWCSSAIAEARLSRWCTDVFVQVEFISDPRQRIDALVGLCFNFAVSPHSAEQSAARSARTIPWYDGLPKRKANHRWIWWAIEIDRGTEPLKTLLGKGVTYRDLTQARVYHNLVGGPVLPVFITPTVLRAGRIAREWQDAWKDVFNAMSAPPEEAKDSVGVAATPHMADHGQHGVLWGAYRSLLRGVAVPLLGEITIDAWVDSYLPDAHQVVPHLQADT